MTDAVTHFLQGFGFEMKLLMTVLISMVPVIELRGAIPAAAAAGLQWYVSIPLAIVGNMLPVPFILLFIKKIFAWLRAHTRLGSLVDRLERRAEKKMGTVRKFEVLGLMLFVAIPLPMTGAWTGALVAALMNLKMKTTILALFAGVVIAAAIVGISTYVLYPSFVQAVTQSPTPA